MVVEILSRMIRRELATLERELSAYADERDIWHTPPGITNSAGTLALHLVGNLRHFVGAVLGGSGYVRNRPAEFADRDVPRSDLIDLIRRASSDVERALRRVGPERLDALYPLEVAGSRLRTLDFLIHLEAHLAYHLGQVDYHRRVVTGEGAGVGAVAPGELLTAAPAEPA
jgi:hypothetical protein